MRDGLDLAVSMGGAQSLTSRTALRLVIVALCYRALAMLVAVAGIAASGTLAPASVLPLAGVTAALLAAHVAALLPRWRVRLPPQTSLPFGLDVGVAATLSLWAATIIPEGTLFFDYRNPVSGYVVGTLALWTGLRGPRLGAVLLVALVGPLQLAMAWLNGIDPGSLDWARFATRSLWLVTAYVVTVLLLGALRRGADAVAQAGERAGRNAQRRETADAIHLDVLGTLVGTSKRAQDGTEPLRQLKAIATEARARAEDLRRVLRSDDLGWIGLYASCDQLVAETRAHGVVDARFVAGSPEPSLAPKVEQAVSAAIGEALLNVERHAGASRVDVEIYAVGGELRATVRDDGCGFDEATARVGYGVPRSIRARMSEAGGTARLRTAPGRGTEWELVVPLPRAAGPQRSSPDATTALVDRALLSLAMVAVAYRVGGLVIAMAGLIGSRSFGPIDLTPLLVVMVICLFGQAALMAAAWRSRLPAVGAPMVAVDVLVTVALMLWAASAIPAGTLFLDYRDPFTLYAQGTLALWAGYLGTRWGLGLWLLFGLAVALLMAAANGLAPSSVDWAKLGSRALWFAPALVLAHMVMRAARDGAILHRAERERAGLEAERGETRSALGRTLVETLDTIARRAEHPGSDPAATLAALGADADRQKQKVRRILNARDRAAADAQAPPHGARRRQARRFAWL